MQFVSQRNSENSGGSQRIPIHDLLFTDNAAAFPSGGQGNLKSKNSFHNERSSIPGSVA